MDNGRPGSGNNLFSWPDGQRRLEFRSFVSKVKCLKVGEVLLQGKRVSERNSGNLMVSSIATSQLPAARDGRFLL